MSRLPLHPMHPIHTGRPVDARWHRITDLADCGHPARDELDDRWIRRGLRFLGRLRASQNQSNRERLAREVPDIDAAYRLHECSDKMERAVVEARLLARQTIGEVAAACNMSVDAVTAYEAIFFQVVGRLDAFLFILPRAVGVNLSGYGLGEDDCDVLLRLFAYQRGPLMMETVLRYFRCGIKVPERLGQTSRADLEELATMLEIRGLILSHVSPFSKIRRANLLMDLAGELRRYIATLPQKLVALHEFAGDLTAQLSSAEHVKVMLADPDCQAVPPNWWTALRETILAA